MHVLDDAAMTDLNRRMFGREGTTDVISATYRPTPGMVGDTTAELFVNAECAVREGTRRGGVARELALYLAHGWDHLSGADDASADDRRRMRRRELRWLRMGAIREDIERLKRAIKG